MKNKNLETHYEKLYNTNLKDIEKNLENFIKYKEETYSNKYETEN